MLTVNQPLSQTHIRSCIAVVCIILSWLSRFLLKCLEAKRSFLHTLRGTWQPRLWMARRFTYSVKRLFRRIRIRYCLRMPHRHRVAQLPCIPSQTCLLRQLRSGFFLGSPVWCFRATVWGVGTSLGLLYRIPTLLGLPWRASQEWFLWKCSNRQCRSCATPHWYMTYPRSAHPSRYIHILASSCSCDWTIAWCTDGWVRFYQRLALQLPQHETSKSTYCS